MEKIIRSTHFRLGFTILQQNYRAFSLTSQHLCEFIGIYKRNVLHKKRVQFPQGWSTWPPFNCFGTTKWPSCRHGQEFTGWSVTTETILAHNFFLALAVENSTLGTIISFETIGISFCWNHHFGTFHSSSMPHPPRMRDFWIEQLRIVLKEAGKIGPLRHLKVQAKKFIRQISFFKGLIQTKIEHSDSSLLYWWGGRGPCRKTINKPLKIKRVESCSSSVKHLRVQSKRLCFFPQQQNTKRLN